MGVSEAAESAVGSSPIAGLLINLQNSHNNKFFEKHYVR